MLQYQRNEFDYLSFSIQKNQDAFVEKYVMDRTKQSIIVFTSKYFRSNSRHLTSFNDGVF